MGNSNQELLLKAAMATADLAGGGVLSRSQQNKFTKLVRSYSSLLSMVRFEKIPQSKFELDKLWVGEPVTRGASEGATTGQSQFVAKFSKVNIDAVKVRSDWALTTESLQNNIESDNFENTLFDAISQRVATDLELLAVNGDTTAYSASTDSLGVLLKVLDGWEVQTRDAHVVDAGANVIGKDLFARALRMLPKQYKNDPGLRWFVPDSLVIDWQDTLSERLTDLGDASLQGTVTAPMGIPIVKTNTMPDDMLITYAAANPATLLGTAFGPFNIITSGATQNDGLSLVVSGTSVSGDPGVTSNGVYTVPFSVTITNGSKNGGAVDGSRVAELINTAYKTAAVIVGAAAPKVDVCFCSADGRLVLRSYNTGTTSKVSVVGTTTTNQNAGTDFFGGYVATSASSSASGSATSGTSNDGGFILLCNPKNLVFAMLDQTRIFAEFNKDKDQSEMVIYNQVDGAVENLDSIVRISNVKKKSLSDSSGWGMTPTS